MTTSYRSTSVVLVCWILASCVGDSLSPAPTGPEPVAAVVVGLPASTLVVGQTMHASATLKDAHGNVLAGRGLAWSSSNESVATVAADGAVLGMAPGAASITASSEGQSGSASLTVTVPPVASVGVTLTSASVAVGGTSQASAVLKDAGGNVLSGRTVTWTSSNTAVANVDATGRVTAVAAGTSAITGASEGQSGSATLTVTAAPVSTAPVASVTVALGSATIAVGSTTQASATLRDANGNVLSGRALAWTSSNSGVATVSSSGLVTAVAAGAATITAASEGKSGSANVSVVIVPVASVTVALSASSVTAGGTAQATATLRDANNNVLTGRTVAWTSSNTSVATVNGSGVVAAVAAGNSTITATSDGKSGSASLTVTAAAPPPTSGHWVSGYWVGYQRDLYPETDVDFSLMTHIIVGAILPTATGGVNTDFYIDGVTGPQVAKTLSTRAHQAGRKAILMLGGAGQHDNMVQAASPTRINTFVANLVATVNNLGYDGIDVDWEPVDDVDKPAIISLLQKLRAAKPGIILTFPVSWVNSNFGADAWYAQLAPLVDQMNLMSYEMAGNWGGWVSWHQGALYGEGGDHPSSVSSSIAAYEAAGVPAATLGIGLGFYGSCWRGTTAPLQTLGATAGVVASDNEMSYTNIMRDYFNAAAYHWDATARAGYLSFSSQTGPAGCTMISYEDERSIAEKGAYVKSAGVGGAIIWTINQGRLPTAPAGSQDPLLKATYNSIVP